MDREKLIEEILSRFCGDHGKDNTCRLFVYGKKCKDIDCAYRRKAVDIVDKYIPEGTVVLTREELETTDKIPQKIKDFYKWFIEIEREQASKEKAREILTKAEKKARFVDGGHYSKDRYELDLADLKTIIKKDFGIEVEE